VRGSVAERIDATVGVAAREPRNPTSRVHDRFEQASRRVLIPHFEPVGDEAVDAEVPCQRPHDDIQPLADENDRALLLHHAPQALDAGPLQVRLQEGLEVLHTQDLEPITAHATKRHVQPPAGERGGGGVEQNAQQGGSGEHPETLPAFGVAVCVPRQESERTDRTQVEEAVLRAPDGLFPCRGHPQHRSMFSRRGLDRS
jgi:hypothetical protein